MRNPYGRAFLTIRNVFQCISDVKCHPHWVWMARTYLIHHFAFISCLCDYYSENIATSHVMVSLLWVSMPIDLSEPWTFWSPKFRSCSRWYQELMMPGILLNCVRCFLRPLSTARKYRRWNHAVKINSPITSTLPLSKPPDSTEGKFDTQ